MGKKSSPPRPPDLKPLSDAQLKIAEQANEMAREYLGLSREQFAWFQENAKEELALAREQADRLFGLQDRAFASDEQAREFAERVGQTQIDAMDLQMDYARRDRERYESVFLPLQDQFIAEAQAYDTPERREAEAARQMVDVQRQAEAQRANADERLRSMGIDPSQVRSSSMINQLGVASAANQAMAGNQARTQIEERGRALRADAINIGNGLPAQSAANYAGAGNAGNSAMGAAVGGQNATLNALQGGAGVAGTALGFRSGALGNMAALTGSPMQWAGMGGNMMGGAMAGYGQAASTLNQHYANRMGRWQAGQDQSQRWFDNAATVASMGVGAMMAEGGAVVDPIKAAVARWKEQLAIKEGKGSGQDGALTVGDRLYNGMSAAADMRQSAAAPAATTRAIPNHLQPAAMPQFDPGQYAYQPMNFSEGGAPRALPVRQSRDKIPAFLTEGEYVLPADVVRAIGLEKIDKMVNKYHREGS